MDFANGMTVIDGCSTPTELSPTRHPVLEILGDGKAEDWNTSELRELRAVLRADPHKLALWQSQDELSPSKQEATSSDDSEVSFYSLAEPEPDLEDLALLQSHMEDEAISGLDQIVHKVPTKEAEPQDDSTDSDSHGSFSSGQSESSHEDGPSSADESTSDSEGEPDRFEDALATGLTELDQRSAAAPWQRRRGGLVFGENPATSKAWKTPEIEEAFDGLAHVQFDQCQVGLARPTNHMPMRKRTIIAGEDGALTELKNKMCPGEHEHYIIEGGYKTETGQWASLAEFGGGYCKELCTALLKGAEAWLTHKTNEAFTEDYEIEDTVPDWMAGEDYIEEQKSRQEAQLDDTLRFDGAEHQGPEDDERHPVSAETRKAVEFAHRQLGHPTRASLTRMLKLGGASQDALRYASEFHCSVCAARQAPRHPKPSTVPTRPFGFNVHLHLDLKYLYDSRKKKYSQGRLISRNFSA